MVHLVFGNWELSSFHLVNKLIFCYFFREKLNSMNLLLYMSPIAVLVLLPATLLMEPDVLEVTLALGMKHRFMWLLLCINSVAAYLANLSNFLVTKHTSALTLQVWSLSFWLSLSLLAPPKRRHTNLALLFWGSRTSLPSCACWKIGYQTVILHFKILVT